MSCTLFPRNPTEEYWKAIREAGVKDPDGDLYFSTKFRYLFVKFFEKNAGISYAKGFTDETCRAMADWIEKNGPPTAEQLPEEWRAYVEGFGKWLKQTIPIWRYAGGFNYQSPVADDSYYEALSRNWRHNMLNSMELYESRLNPFTH